MTYANRVQNRGTLLVGAVVATLLLFVTVGATAPGGPLPPTNLRVINVTQDSVQLAWTGPPGPFFILAETKNSVTVGWEPAMDGNEAVSSYTVWKDGNVVGNPTTNGFMFGGMPGRKAKTFRICVQAITISQLRSAQSCGTITKL
jgi:hypothetical protein